MIKTLKSAYDSTKRIADNKNGNLYENAHSADLCGGNSKPRRARQRERERESVFP